MRRERLRIQQLLRVDRHESGVGDVLVAHEECLLGHFDAQVDVIGAVGRDLVETELVEDAEYHQRCRALSRWRHVVKRAETVLQHDRRAQFGAVAAEIGEQQRAAELGELAGYGARELSFVKIAQPVFRQLAHGCGEFRLFQHRTCVR